MTIENTPEFSKIIGYTVEQYLSMLKVYYLTINDVTRLKELDGIASLIAKHGISFISMPSLPEADNGNKVQYLEVSIHSGKMYHTETDEVRFSYHHGTTGDNTLLARTAGYLESLIEN